MQSSYTLKYFTFSNNIYIKNLVLKTNKYKYILTNYNLNI